MSRREVPKLNKDNFSTWKILMKLHLRGIHEYVKECIKIEHVDPATPTTNDMRKKKEHNQAMLKIASALSYAEFDDIKGFNSAKKMWDSLKTIYGGDKNVQRTLSEHSKPKFHSKTLKRKRKRRKERKSMYPLIVTQMKKTLNNWRHYLQEYFTEEK